MKIQNISTNYQTQAHNRQPAFGWTTEKQIPISISRELEHFKNVAESAKNYTKIRHLDKPSEIGDTIDLFSCNKNDGRNEVIFFNIGTPKESMLYLGSDNTAFYTTHNPLDTPEIGEWTTKIKRAFGLIEIEKKKTPSHYIAPFDGAIMKLSPADLDKIAKTKATV